MTELTESFWMGFYTFTGGFILAVLAIAYRSKCSNVNICWGMLSIERDVEVELREDLKQIEATLPVDERSFQLDLRQRDMRRETFEDAKDNV